MSRKKKNDFWDDVDDEKVASYDSPEEEGEAEAEEEWSAFKSTPVKVILRIFLMIACIVSLVSGYVIYQYVQDRYAGGSYSPDFFDSASFADQYSSSVDQITGLLGAMEADSEITKDGNEELLTTMVENYMGKDTNFSFIIQDKDHYTIVSSGDDAKDRIESSTHYALITYTGGKLDVKTSLADNLLDESGWLEKFARTKGEYIIYTAVDNDLTYQDAYYTARQSFDRMGSYFGVAKIVGIAALVIFIICLIFCIIATGQKKGYDGVYLSFWDRVFTEPALIVMIGVAAVLIWAVRHFMAMDGNMMHAAAAALGIVTYIWIAQSYFSIVRRIKAGRLFRCSIVGSIVRGIGATIGKLPFPVNAIIEAILLIIVNGGIVYLAVRERSYSFHGVRVFLILAGAAAVIELVGLISYATGGDSSSDDEEEEETAEEEQSAIETLSADVEADRAREAGEDEKASAAEADIPHIETDGFEEEQDWETMDLSKVIASAEKEKKQQREEDEASRTHIYAVDDEAIERVRKAHAQTEAAARKKTQVLTPEEMEDALRASGVQLHTEDAEETTAQSGDESGRQEEAAGRPDTEEAGENAVQVPEDSGRVNFIQLNKEVRRHYRPRLKPRGIIVTMRSPEKPVIIDIDKSSLSILISNIFDQIERLSADNVRNYLEAYVQGGKVVYIARINVADDMLEAAGQSETDGSFDDACKIIEANGGRFALSIEGSVMRVGMLMDAAS